MGSSKDLKPRTRRKKTEISAERQSIRDLAESDLEEFIRIVQPRRILGDIHRRVIRWWSNCDDRGKSKQLLLLPRDHQKSTLIALRVAWELTKDPTLRVLYISSTSNLAIKQLKFIKDVFLSDNYRALWPDMVHKDEAKREKWTEREISLDDPRRKHDYIRDPSIFTAGLTSNIVGLHCDIAVLDDVVVEKNAYTEEGREKVKDQYSHLSSVEGTQSQEWVVGTRYHPKDLYSDLAEMETFEYDEIGTPINSEPLFEILEEQVESLGNGYGEFLWPRQKSPHGKWYGFDSKVLAEKKSQYLNQVHFRAQYYNNPNDDESSPIKRECFQYYEPSYITKKDGRWFFKGSPISVVAAVDFAYSMGKRSDATAIVVVGVDSQQNYYVLDIDRFKTQAVSEYFKHILYLFEKWGFRKIRAEVSVAQVVIVKDLKESYIKPLGLSLAVEEYRPSRWEGAKEERILSTLEPRYANRQIWHYPGGNCSLLEEELILQNPAHDDIKDTLASAIDFAQGMSPYNFYRQQKMSTSYMNFNPRWGGVS
jgi:hypothetical protein